MRPDLRVKKGYRMKKLHITRQTINNCFRKVFRCGYCDLQYIMRGTDAMYYNAGIYGWNFDCYLDYEFDTAITTGYRNMTGERIPSEILTKYTEKAKSILIDEFKRPYNEIMQELDTNRKAFFKELNDLHG